MSACDNASRRGWRRAAKISVFTAWLAVLLLTGTATPAQNAPDPAAAARKQRLPLIGGGATEATARLVGATKVMGKAIPQPSIRNKPLTSASEGLGPTARSSSGSVSDRPPRSPNNAAIRWFPNVSENEPTVAANPKDPRRMVAGSHFTGDSANRCIAHYSRNGGRTWNPIPIFTPQLLRESECSDPVLAYAPDGSRVYYAYMDIKASQFDVVLSYSDDNGRSWHGPIIALSTPAHDYDKPWIGTHVPVSDGHDDGNRQSNSNWVYVTATRFPYTGTTCTIEFTRSSNKGLMWSAPQALDTGICSGPDEAQLRVVQGSRPTGGLGRDVLVAWYHSGVDGWLTGSFQIRTRYSANHGATFGPIVVASNDTFELPFWLGPDAAYHRWWGGMFPDVEIAPNGTGHITYTHDPVAGSATAEDGDIRYINSAAPPYATWSEPITLNDDASGKAQGWATLKATSRSHGSTTIYALWEDHRTSDTDNRYYDVFWTSTGNVNQKLTDAKSSSDYIFLGDYFDITVAGRHDDNFVYGVWSDRRDEPSIFDSDDDVWGARLDSNNDRD
jgi:hypothetical protein